MMISYNQIYLHQILKNIVDKEYREHVQIIEIFSPQPIDAQHQQPIQQQNLINTQSFQPIPTTKSNDCTLVSSITNAK